MNWALNRGVSCQAVTDLLHILHPYHELPLDSRSLLGTPRETIRKTLVNGEYCHFGLATGLLHQLKHIQVDFGNTIEISFNIDGLPLFKNGHKSQLWPILAYIKRLKCKPFAVGSFLGDGKPETLSN